MVEVHHHTYSEEDKAVPVVEGQTLDQVEEAPSDGEGSKAILVKKELHNQAAHWVEHHRIDGEEGAMGWNPKSVHYQWNQMSVAQTTAG